MLHGHADEGLKCADKTETETKVLLNDNSDFSEMYGVVTVFGL